ncbi:MAG: helix-turn-helix transcriptional regulator [Prevotella sp.]|nr:helix-turn-helix transcriptional regulator [Prevotella sp.]
MYDQPLPQSILFFMLYAAVAMTAIIASCYLLLRRGNAFAPDNTPPIRLRRWTAAFFASIAMGHLWYLPTAFLTSSGDMKLSLLVGASLDFMIFFPLSIIVMLTILQDRRRPLWPVPLMTVPPVIGVVWCIVSRSDALVPAIYAYLLLLGISLTIYLVRELRQYGRWLRDNFADLEHKEVWHTFIVLASILLLLSYYVLGIGGPIYEYIIQISGFVLVCYLLWRVETLSDLSISHPLSCSTEEATVIEDTERNGLPQATYDNISSLLQRFCIDTQLYLQHDLTLSHLAQAIGTNRTYLTNYFSNQGITYNTYINNLRIDHFVSLYSEAVAKQRPFTARQLASDSGYRNYSTFSVAFKQRMGQNVSAWMLDQA